MTESKLAKAMAKKDAKPSAPKTPQGSQALARARASIVKMFKDDVIVPLTPDTLTKSMAHIPTGSIIVDFLIGGAPNQFGVPPCPGVPRGRITQLYGNAGAGKTTLALTIAAQVCAAGGCVAYIDWENEVEPRYAAALGVPITDGDRFMLLQPETLEQGMQTMVLLASEGVDLIVVDSVGAGVPSDLYHRDLEKEGESGRIGLVAQKWSQFLPKFKHLMSKSNTALVAISQLRKTMATMGMGPDSAPQGGEGWKFYSSIRIMLRVFNKEKGKVLDPITNKMEEKVVGTVVSIKLDKNKVGNTAHHEQKFYLKSGSGIDNARTVFDIAQMHGIIRKRGSYYDWPGSPQGDLSVQGTNAFMAKLNSDRELLQGLFNAVLPKLAAQAPEAPTELAEDEAMPALDSAEIDAIFKAAGADVPAPAPPEE